MFGRACAHARLPETIDLVTAYLQAYLNSPYPIFAILEPVLGPIRKRMPQTGAIDFSPLVLIIALQIMLIILSSIIRSVA